MANGIRSRFGKCLILMFGHIFSVVVIQFWRGRYNIWRVFLRPLLNWIFFGINKFSYAYVSRLQILCGWVTILNVTRGGCRGIYLFREISILIFGWRKTLVGQRRATGCAARPSFLFSPSLFFSTIITKRSARIRQKCIFHNV